MKQEALQAPGGALVQRLGLTVLLAVGLFFGFQWWIGQSVVDDAVDRYEIAVRAGDQVAACQQAEAVADAQLYAKREEQWQRWSDIARRACLGVAH